MFMVYFRCIMRVYLRAVSPCEVLLTKESSRDMRLHSASPGDLIALCQLTDNLY